MENPPSPRRFRIQSKGWFLTYPKCSLTKEEVLQALKAKRPGLTQVIVSRELHEDGTPHLHCYLYYDKQVSISNERYFDLGSFHPNVQSAKSLRAVQAYIKKDGDFIQEGIDYAANIAAITDHRAYLGKRLIDGESLTDLTKEFPQLLFRYKNLKENVAAFRADQVPNLPRCTGFIPNTFGLIMPLCSEKKRHYWFWSPCPNKGKTLFLLAIREQFPSLWYSWRESFQTPAPHAQFVLLDEYTTGHLTVTQLNMMCDGTYQYPVKGSDSFSLPGSILLICGNKSPLDIYSEEHHELLKARFIINCLP